MSDSVKNDSSSSYWEECSKGKKYAGKSGRWWAVYKKNAGKGSVREVCIYILYPAESVLKVFNNTF